MLDWVVNNLWMYQGDCRFLSLESILILVSGICFERCRYHSFHSSGSLLHWLLLFFLHKNNLSKNYSMLTISFFWNYWARTSRNRFYFQKWNWSLLVLSFWEFLFNFSNHYISSSTWSLTKNQHFSPLTCLNLITGRSAKLVLGTEPCGLVMH